MSVIQLMVKKIEIGTVSAVDGTVSDWEEVKAYNDTVTLDEPDPTVTEHYAAGQSSPRLTISIPGVETLGFQIMDSDPDNCEIALGGTVTTVNNKKTWNKPKGFGSERIRAVRVTTVDDYQYVQNKASVTGKKMLTFANTGIGLLDVKFRALDTGFPAIPDVTWGQI
ncbi:hypothetical protein [Pedobacter zeae]|uniref:Phage tail protein n=1 Tax=Pedobacter zeae TaxID=1737356 RepID=A0A7W6K7I3_9SPHI|nr:hypothetical protein [Pedobacter zeae]MBB4106619.1 hypothetical protein [Pedobacter zeae]GGH02753.1 hypothetical protein GCM10007422_17390 [Pedobacter zeae]